MSEKLFQEQLIVAYRALEEIAESLSFRRVWGLENETAALAHCLAVAERALVAINELEDDNDL